MNRTISIGLLLVLVLLPNYNTSEVTEEAALLFQLTTDSSSNDFLLSSDTTLRTPAADELLETTTGNFLKMYLH